MDKSIGQLHTDGGQNENSTHQAAEAETTDAKQIRKEINVLAVEVGVPVKKAISNDCRTHDGNAIASNNIKTDRSGNNENDELTKQTTNLSNGNDKHKQHCDIELDSETKQICEKVTIAIDKPNHETIEIKVNGSLHVNVNDKKNILHDACNLHEEIIASNVKSVTKSQRQSNDPEIKANGSLSSAVKISTKKAISLEKIDETVRKFIGGEVIVDKENPFKKLNAKRRADFFSSVPVNVTNSNRKTTTVQLPTDEFSITTKDVLNESKFVKTYIKNPDEYFAYDPTLKERLLKEEQRELAEKRRERISLPKKSTATRISRLTHERLRELKNKYSPSPLYSQQRTRSNPICNGHAVNGGPNAKLPKVQNKKVDRSKYPDLSQIKVKTGTDLEESFFNPKEVAINAKKFDARIKNTQFGSQDDLDEIVDLTSDFDANGLDELDAEIIPTNGLKILHEDHKIEAKEAESLTNTINSKEFQEYLAKKGLILKPEIQKLKANSECIVIRVVENKEKMASPTIQNDADSKKSRKPSVLQRLFPNGFFSSRRRTTPKDASPEPIKLVENVPKKDGRLANAKRLVLHRQSMPAKYDDYTVNGDLKMVGTFGSSSSISSTLTNSEYIELKRSENGKLRQTDSEASRSLSGLRYIDSSSNSTIVTCDKNNKHNDPQRQQMATKPVPRPRQQIGASGRTSVPVNGSALQTQHLKPVRQSKENIPMASQRPNKMSENRDRDSVSKPRAQRPKIPITNGIRPLVNAKSDGTWNQSNEKKLNGLSADGDKKRVISKLPERLNKPIANSQSSKSNPNDSHLNRNEAQTPDTPIKSNAPKSTSTPLAECSQPNFDMRKCANAEHSMQENSLNISPIPKLDTTNPIHGCSNVQMDANTWAKVRELKEKSDRQLYAQPLLVQAQANVRPMQYDQRHLQPIYDRLPVHNVAYNAQPLYAKVEKRSAIPVNATLIRNAPYRQSFDQIKLQSNQQQMPNQTVVYRPVFIRNSPQRNTISGVYRGATMQRMSPQICQTPITILQAQQPQRPQSVLDEMMTGRNMQASPSPSVQLRRKGQMSRGEIMNQVIEFCRKSMDKTPTKFFGVSNEHIASMQKDTNSSEVSPISYASVATSKTSPSIASSNKIRPQVPIRKQSLQQQQQQQSPPVNQMDPHLIYERIPRHNQVQTPVQMVNDENKPVNGLVGHYAIPTKRYIIMDSENITPAQVKQYQRINGGTIPNNQGNISSLNQQIYNQSPVAQKSCGRIHLDTNPYDYIHVCSDNNNPTIGNNLLQIYQPNATAKSSSTVNGRFTPAMLPTIPQNQQVNASSSSNGTVEMHLPPGYTKTKVFQKAGRIVVLNNVEQMYRPIAVPTKTVRHQTSQTSLDCRHSVDTIDSQQANQICIQKEDWQNDKGKNQQNDQDERRRGGRNRTPDDNRRHTLSNDMMVYAQQNQNQLRSLDLEMGMRAQKMKKQPLPVRGYAPVNQGPLFDDDPGIMSEVETASTGFRRGNKTRSSLPVVRTPSKTLERPLGLVFLQYRSETKRALLPNEITSIDTVRALFVRSFPRQLTMNYLEGPNVKIYIHDANKDMFYELEDVRSHLREIRDRSVLRLFESNEVNAPQVLPAGPGVPQPLPQTGSHWDQDQYFSEPEFDTEYSHQHVHKNKGSKGAPYYVGAAQTLPRGMYSDRNKNIIDGYMSSPERGTRGSYEEPYYSQYGTRGSSVAPIIIDEELSDVSLSEDQYALYGGKSGRIPRNAAGQIYDPTRPEDLHRIRVEHMERQLANLTGLVQKALHQTPPNVNQNYLGVPGQYRDKSVSFEKSVSFSDDIQGLPKSHSPQHHVDSKPPKPAIKSSTLPRTSSQERDRLKPAPPPKPMALAPTHISYRPDLALAPEVYNHLRGLQKRTRDLRMEARTLRRLTQAQAVAVREDIKDAFMGIRATLLASVGLFNGHADQEKTRLTREEEIYKQEVLRLEKDLCDLESSVEILRGEVINRRTRVNMAAVEDMALILSRASKMVAELKLRFPILQITLRNVLSNEMEKVVREEKFLSEEPDRLESALRRCKKLTGTLVTLKRLASVQEQRIPGTGPESSSIDENSRSAENHSMNKSNTIQRMGSITLSAGIAPENALDALLDELQTFSKPAESRIDDSTSDDSSQNIQPINNTVTTQISQATIYSANELAPPNNNPSNLRRLHSYPSGSDTDTSPPQQKMRSNVGKPPVPERNSELLSKVANKRAPPAPPPRTSSSKSPLPSPTTQNANIVSTIAGGINEIMEQNNGDGGNSSGNESTNSQERQAALEFRHQELLKKQKQLQEQYARLQQVSKTGSIQIADTLKKTGSESNLPLKMGLNMAVSGSMKNLNVTIGEAEKNDKNKQQQITTTKQVYETDIL